MSKAKDKNAKLKGGELIENDHDEQAPSRFAVLKATKDIDQLPTWEVIRRIYKRHNTGIWQLLAVVPWVITIWVHL